MDNNDIPMTRAEKLILEELQQIKKLLSNLIEKEIFNSIEELSLHRVTKILHVGQEKIIDYVERGLLAAHKYKDSNRKLRYRFRLSDIKKFQNENFKQVDRELNYSFYRDPKEIFNEINERFEYQRKIKNRT